MINLYNYSEKRLTDIADVVRTTKGTVYPKGTIYIQVSACSKTEDNPFKLLGGTQSLKANMLLLFLRLTLMI